MAELGAVRRSYRSSAYGQRYFRPQPLSTSVAGGGDPFANQAKAFNDQLKFLQDQEAFRNAAQGNDPQSLIDYWNVRGKDMPADDPNRPIFEHMVGMAQDRVDELNWQAKVKNDPNELEGYMSYLQDKLPDAAQDEAPALLQHLSDVKTAIQARDENAADRSATLDYLNSRNHGKMIDYLQSKLGRTTDAKAVGQISDQIQRIQQTQYGEESAKRMGQRAQLLNTLQNGKGNPQDVITKLNGLLSTPGLQATEVAAIQKDIDNAQKFSDAAASNAIAKQRTEAFVNYSKDPTTASTQIAALEKLLETTKDTTEVNAIQSTITQIVSREDARIAKETAAIKAGGSAASFKTQADKFVAPAEAKYEEMLAAVKDTLSKGGVPSKDDMRALEIQKGIVQGQYKSVSKTAMSSGFGQESTPFLDKGNALENEYQTTANTATTKALKGNNLDPASINALSKFDPKNTDAPGYANSLGGKIAELKNLQGTMPTPQGEKALQDAIDHLTKTGRDNIVGVAHQPSRIPNPDAVNVNYMDFQRDYSPPKGTTKADFTSSLRTQNYNQFLEAMGYLDENGKPIDGAPSQDAFNQWKKSALGPDNVADSVAASRQFESLVQNDSRILNYTPTNHAGKVGGSVTDDLSGPGETSRGYKTPLTADDSGGGKYAAPIMEDPGASFDTGSDYGPGGALDESTRAANIDSMMKTNPVDAAYSGLSMPTPIDLPQYESLSLPDFGPMMPSPDAGNIDNPFDFSGPAQSPDAADRNFDFGPPVSDVTAPPVDTFSSGPQ